MRTSSLLVSSLLLLSLGTAWADTKTDDSTDRYAPSDQYNEKLHQKPVAEDANSGSDMSTTKDTSQSSKKHRLNKHKRSGSSTGTSSTDGSATSGNQ